jgi:hypothetical protein
MMRLHLSEHGYPSASFSLKFPWIPSTALLVSMKQISLKPGGKLIALALTAKKWFLPVGL